MKRINFYRLILLLLITIGCSSIKKTTTQSTFSKEEIQLILAKEIKKYSKHRI